MRWDGVDVTLHDQEKASQCSISVIGMFLGVRNGTNRRFVYIFLPDFTPGPVIGDQLAVHIQCVSMVEVSHFVIFQKEADAIAFIELASEVIVKMQSVVSNLGAFNNEFSVDLMGLMPGSSKPHHFTLKLEPQVGCITLTRKGRKRVLSIADIHCAPLTRPCKRFKQSAHTEWAFEIRDPATGVYVCVCSGEQEMMQIVMVTYIHSFRITWAKNRALQSKLEDKGEMEDARCYESSGYKSQFEIEIESIYPEPAPPQPALLELSLDVSGHNEGERMIGQKSDREEPERGRTFLSKERQTRGKCREKYEKMIGVLGCMHLKEPVELPSMRELAAPKFAASAPSNEEIRSIIAEACGVIDTESGNDVFRKYDKRTTEELISEIHSDEDEPQPVDISSFVELKDFPGFPLQEFNQASEPSTPFLSVLTEVSQHLLECGGRVVGNDPLGRRIATLIIAILTNGMPDKSMFFDAYSFFCNTVDGLASAIGQAKKGPSPWEQISLFVIILLNTDSVVPLLKSMWNNDTWIHKNFLIAALIRCDSLFEDILNILQSTLLQVRFQMIPVTDLVLGGDPALVDRFIQSICMNHLGIKECIKTPPFIPDLHKLLRFLFRLLSSYVQAKYSPQERETPGKTAFSFIRKLVRSQFLPKNKDWNEMADVTRVIASGTDEFTSSLSHMLKSGAGKADERLSNWIENGLIRKKIHIWIFYLTTNRPLASKYFLPESVLLDMYRFKYVLSYLASFT